MGYEPQAKLVRTWNPPSAQELAAAARAGWAGGRFALAWAPVLGVRDGSSVAWRASLRWTHPQLGPIELEPDGEIARQAGVHGLLDEWLFEQVLAQVAHTEPVDTCAPAAQLRLGVQTLTQPFQAERLRARCQAAGVAPGRLQIVLCSQTLSGLVAPAARSLGEAGFGLVLDNVVTSRIGLDEWLGLPLVALGVPMAWIRAQAADEPLGRSRVQALVRVAHACGAWAAAHGADAPQDLSLLRQLRLDTAAGLAVADAARTQPLLARKLPASSAFTV